MLCCTWKYTHRRMTIQLPWAGNVINFLCSKTAVILHPWGECAILNWFRQRSSLILFSYQKYNIKAISTVPLIFFMRQSGDFYRFCFRFYIDLIWNARNQFMAYDFPNFFVQCILKSVPWSVKWLRFAWEERNCCVLAAAKRLY